MNKDEIENISNRPEVLYSIPFYKDLPPLPLKLIWWVWLMIFEL